MPGEMLVMQVMLSGMPVMMLVIYFAFLLVVCEHAGWHAGRDAGCAGRDDGRVGWHGGHDSWHAV